jgi:PAS domain S-box-containing protein
LLLVQGGAVQGREHGNIRPDEVLRDARLRLLDYAAGHSPREILARAMDEIGALTASPLGFYQTLEDEGPIQKEHRPLRGELAPSTMAIRRELVVPVLREGCTVALAGVANKGAEYTEADRAALSFLADVAFEVSSRRHQNLQIAEQRKVFDLVFEQALAGFWDWHIPGGKLVMSHRFKAVLGYEDDELPNTQATWEKLVHPEDMPALLERFRVHAESRGQVPYLVEVRYLHKSGAVVWISCTGTIIEWAADGQPVRMVGCHADITARKAAEEALRRAREETEDLYDNAPCGYHSVDAEGRFTRVNATEAAWLGYSREELLGRRLTEFLDATSASQLPANWGRGLQAGALSGLEVTYVRKDGRPLHALLNVSWIRDGAGGPVVTRTTMVDISERKRMEQDLEAARDASAAASQAKSAFLASMSHEIRTPMNAVLGFAQLMLRDPATTPLQRQRLQAVTRAGDHLLVLIDQILQVAKIEAGRLALDEATFDLPAMLDELETIFDERATAKRLRLAVERVGELPRYVAGDESKLRQILANLVGNAVKFTETGGVAVRIACRGTGAERRLVVEVEDTGPGIAPEEMPRLFQKFEQTESGRRTLGGTGLGLAISRELARLMGGEIVASSQPGQGSVFRLEVPLKEGSPEDVARRVAERRVHRLAPGQPSTRVLVADDKDDNRAFLCGLLEAVGFETRQARDGEEAVRTFQDWRPQLVLMDMRMPHVDGAEAVRRIRSCEGGAEVRIIAVTASAFEEDRQEARAVGVDDFIGKPFRESVLFEKIRGLLGVSFEYVVEAEQAAPPRPPRGDLTRQAVAALPPELRARLRRATIGADLDLMLELLGLAELRDVEAAGRLRELAERFAYEEILELLEG